MKGIQLLLLQKTTKPETTKLGINENSHCKMMHIVDQIIDCLLYTSDAADERSSVDLGGRRIIKKKKSKKKKTRQIKIKQKQKKLKE